MEADGKRKAERHGPALIRGRLIAAGQGGLTVCLLELRPGRLDGRTAKRSSALNLSVCGDDNLEDECAAANVPGDGAGRNDGLGVGDDDGLSGALAGPE